MVSDIRHMLKSQEIADSQDLSVSVTHTLSITEHTLTVAQRENRSAISTTEESSVSYAYV